MGDEQDRAESVDEETVGADAVTSDEVGAFDDARTVPSASRSPMPTSPTSRSPNAGREEPPNSRTTPMHLCGWSNRTSSSTATCSSGSTKTATLPNQTDPPLDRCDQIGRAIAGHARSLLRGPAPRPRSCRSECLSPNSAPDPTSMPTSSTSSTASSPCTSPPPRLIPAHFADVGPRSGSRRRRPDSRPPTAKDPQPKTHRS
jgi:hypothetical protein